MSSHALSYNEAGFTTVPRVRRAKPDREPVEDIDPREILRWSLEWPAVTGEPRYEPVLAGWKVRIS